MTIIDTHAHLDQLENLDEALRNAYEAGVEGIVAVSMDVASCRKNLEIKRAQNQPKIYLAMGMHPSEAKREFLEVSLKLIREHVAELNAIGEIGLDFWYKWAKKDDKVKEEQREVFRRHLEMAREFNLPVVIHSRGAWQECFETAKAVGVKKANFHWYSGPIDVLREILAQGYFVSTSPSVAHSPQSREAMSFAPIEQTMIETDCPVVYRSGPDDPGFRAEPKHVFKTLEAYCALKNIDQKNALEILNRNAKEFFGIKK